MSDPQPTILPVELLDAARKAIDANRAAGRRIVLAESCTGGLAMTALTEIAGSSDVLEGGFVTYSDESKTALLGVSADVLETFGAVSVAVAWSMAQGALKRTGADTAVAVTGIAGPGGGSERKPVGTVIFARARRGADPNEIVADTRHFGDLGRGGVRLQAALCALELLTPEAGGGGP
ncbi:MAG TPA: CinA family protein [Allosphingosinicella sp.]|nr:CinA family protein [Allosphingosinicella sp.]